MLHTGTDMADDPLSCPAAALTLVYTDEEASDTADGDENAMVDGKRFAGIPLRLTKLGHDFDAALVIQNLELAEESQHLLQPENARSSGTEVCNKLDHDFITERVRVLGPAFQLPALLVPLTRKRGAWEATR